MGQLSIFLPPFAPDYSGSCSLLYALNSLIVIHDAQGCTANYTGFDEPRWYGSKKGVFCSGLRKIDVAMGEEERYIRRVLDAAEELKPEVIAIVGSPVPLVIGTDFEGLAREIEERSEVPTLGLNTNGLGQYWEGISKAGIELLDRFLPEVAAREEKIEKSVNLLGITPLDFTSEQIERIEEKVRAAGYEILCSFGRESDSGKLRRMSRAKLNLVVNQAGLKVAEWMERYFSIPYLAGLPMGNGEAYFQAVQKSIKEGCSHLMGGGKEGREMLIIHDPLIALAIAGGKEGARAATAFRADEALEDRVLVLDTEADLEREVNSGYKSVMADPLILDLIHTDAKKIPLSHFAVSSHFRKGGGNLFP